MANLLLIDDDAVILQLLTMCMELEGWSAVTAGDGEEAIRVLKENKFDLIVVDLQMPVMDGFHFLQWLGANQPSHPPVIVLSGAGHGEVAKDALAAGAALVMQKPFSPEEFVDKARELLD